MSLPNMDYKPILSQLHGLLPQDVMTALATILQEIYKINRNGGHGSRRQVADLLIKLGIQPN